MMRLQKVEYPIEASLVNDLRRREKAADCPLPLMCQKENQRLKRVGSSKI